MAAPQLARASSLKLAPALAALSREVSNRMDLEAGPSTAAEAAVPASRAQPNKVRQRSFVAFSVGLHLVMYLQILEDL